MKKNILIALFALLCSSIRVAAQDDLPANDEKLQKLQALYVAFVTKRLELTTEEAQKFWPVHTQFLNEIKAVKADLPELDRQQAILNIKKKYHSNFSRILGPARAERFFEINGEFNKKLLERIKKRQQQRQGRRFNPPTN